MTKDAAKPRFTLRTLFWLVLVVASFFAGQASLVPTLRRNAAERDRLRAMNATLLDEHESLQSELIDLREGTP